MQKSDRIVVGGGGGFIGGHLVRSLIDRGFTRVRSVDIKPLDEWYQVLPEAENLVLDLSLRENCFRALDGARVVYNLAADMGGMGFIENNKALCMLSVLINTHLLVATRELGTVDRYFYASSACVYNADKQKDESVTGAEGGGRVSGDARGRVRLGEAVQRALVRVLRQEQGCRSSHRSLPQHLRPERHVRGW